MKTLGKLRGFTLVELITILSILGIVGAIAVPTIMSTRPNLRLREGARLVYQTLQEAKIKAIKRNGAIRVDFLEMASCTSGYAPAGGGGKMQLVLIDKDDNDKDVETPLSTVALPPQVALCEKPRHTNCTQASKVEFLHTGLPSVGTNTTIVLTNTNARNLYVKVSTAGRVRLTDADCK